MLRHLTLRQAAFLLTLFLLILGGVLVVSMRYIAHDLAEIETSWTEFQVEQNEKARLETRLRAVLGYGGLIHDFKNYTLRKDDGLKYSAFEAVGVARSLISQYRNIGATPAEESALQDIDQTVVAYEKALDQADRLIRDGRTAREIDGAIRVSDQRALRGLDTLRAEILRTHPGNGPASAQVSRASHLRAALGYGGMIHDFKNYVLRGDPQYAEAAEAAMREIRHVIGGYRTASPTPGERVAIQDIEAMLETYRQNLPVVRRMADEGRTAEDIDAAVKVDDTLALRGLVVLDKEAAHDINRRSEGMTQALQRARTFQQFAGWGVVAVIGLWGGLSLWLIHGLVIRPVRGLTHTMKRLAAGELNAEIVNLSLNNEIGEMARAVRVFKRTAQHLLDTERTLSDRQEEFDHQVKALREMRDRSEQQASKAVSLAENLAVAREMAEKATARAEADELQIRTIVDTATDAIITVTAKGVIETFNAAAQTIFGWRAGEVIGRNISLLMPAPHQALHDEYMTGYMEERPSGIVGRVRELEGVRRDGSVFPIELSVNAMRIRGELKFTGVIRDITERKKAEEDIRRLAMTDTLTGVANRHQFLKRFEDALSLARRKAEWKLAVMMIDLDRFKPVNDAYGHPVGDALLKEVAKQLRKQTRETDTVARLGGDEFALVLVDSGDREAVGALADRIMTAICAPTMILGNDVQVGASLGVAFYPEDGSDPEELLRKADMALYAAKEKGQNSWCFHEASNMSDPRVPDGKSATSRGQREKAKRPTDRG